MNFKVIFVFLNFIPSNCSRSLSPLTRLDADSRLASAEPVIEPVNAGRNLSSVLSKFAGLVAQQVLENAQEFCVCSLAGCADCSRTGNFLANFNKL